MLAALAAGLLFGFFGSMPLAGPISVLVFSRGIQGRFRTGLFTALGASVAESLYALFAFWGFAALLAEHPFMLPVSRALAAVLLVYLGVSFLRDRVTAQAHAGRERRRHALLAGFLVTALNPTLLATWSAATTTLYSLQWVPFEARCALPFALGVLVGDVLWYGLMLHLTRRHRGRLGSRTLTHILRTTGLFLVLLGLYFGVLSVRGG
jgi:threonine/homoserine/homoserine lactone efflux protein